MHTERAQRLQHRIGPGEVVDGGPLGDLQGEPRGVDPLAASSVRTRSPNPGSATCRPATLTATPAAASGDAASQPSAAAEHPGAERDDQAVSSASGTNSPAPRSRPSSSQRTSASNPTQAPVPQRHDRLHLQAQRAPVDGPRQGAAAAGSAAGPARACPARTRPSRAAVASWPRTWRGRRRAPTPPPRRSGPASAAVGPLERDADARPDAGAERRGESLDVQRPRRAVPRGRRTASAACPDGDEHGELVAAQAGREVASGRTWPSGPRAAGGRAAVAGGVARGVVDALEAVEVEEEHGRSGRLPQPVGRPREEGAAAEQPGQRVGGRLPRSSASSRTRSLTSRVERV